MRTVHRNLLEESLAAIEGLKQRLAAAEAARREPIAIVGMGCRLPGGIETPGALWQTLVDGIDSVEEVPRERWDLDAYYDPDPKARGKMITRRIGTLRGIDRFDPIFFGISPREALTIDPQHRLLLETSFEAMERAGLAADRLAGTQTGVFAGVSFSDYGTLVGSRGVESIDVYAGTGNAGNVAAGRIAFTFGFHGPCVSVDTACSSSLVAIHLAVQSLRNGECNLALAGGVNVILSPEAMVMLSNFGMLSPEGRCATFADSANGYVRAEGCAMLALKRLSDALRDQDPVVAVIRGSATNHDGKSSGLTVPSGPAQQACVREALANAGLKPADIDYIEAHGTGTPLGDPIEVEALGTVMAEGHTAERPVLLGALKSNIGHTEAASGAAGIVKIALALEHGLIPANLHFDTPNRRIAWDRYPVKVIDSHTPWLRSDRPRRAGISAFGFSGTNAHLIIEEPPACVNRGTAPATGPVLVPLSGRDQRALNALAARHADDVHRRPEIALEDRALSLAVGRAHHGTRAAIVADNADQLAEALRALSAGKRHAAVVAGAPRQRSPKIAFLFTGQGAQYAGMGRGLYDTEPVFRRALDRCATLLEGRLPHPLLEVLWGESGVHLDETAFTQPALFALEFALAELWRSWGVVPSVVLGHSVGEYVAACVAGMMSLEEAIAVIAERGRLMQSLPAGGAMAQIFATEVEVAAVVRDIGDGIAIAAVNGPDQIVVSGREDLVECAMADFRARGVRAQRLAVSHAFHSALLDPILDEFERIAARVTFHPPQCTLISNLTGRAVPGDTAPSAGYWRRHARGAVRFADCIAAAAADGCDLFIEIGPTPTLTSLAAAVAPLAKATFVHSLRRNREDHHELTNALAAAYTAGAKIDWSAVWHGRAARRVALPTYPFQRERYWVDGTAITRARPASQHALLGERIVSPLPTAEFVAELSVSSHAWVAEHVIHETVLLPGSAYVEIGLAAANALGAAGRQLEDLDFLEALPVEGGIRVGLHMAVEPTVDGTRRFAVRSHVMTPGGSPQWRTHATGAIRMNPEVAVTSDVPDTSTLREQCTERVDVTGLYQRFAAVGLGYGGLFRAVREIRVNATAGLAVGRIEAPTSSMTAHPAALDACSHVLAPLLLARDADSDKVYLPTGVEQVWFERPTTPSFWCAVRIRAEDADGRGYVIDMRLETDAGALIGFVNGLRMRETSAAALRRALGRDEIATTVQTVRWNVADGEDAGIDEPVVLLADRTGMADALAIALTGAGVETRIERCVDSSFNLATGTVVDCRALEDGRIGSTMTDVWELTRTAYQRLLALGRRLDASGARAALVVVTRGAHAVQACDDVEPVHTALLGLTRTIAAERSAGPTRRVDLEIGTPLDQATPLLAALRLGAKHAELAVRGGELLVPTLAEVEPVQPAPPGTRATCRIQQRGAIENLALVRQPRRAPGDSEVEIEIRAAGVNFRDLLNVLGMYPGDPGQPGSECSGTIVRVGDSVTTFRPGDEVVAFARESLGTHTTVEETLVLRKPSNIGFADAVTLPNAFVTAYHSLQTVSGLHAGQRILVHAASGGVGMAAVRLARLAGAEVIGTAGSPAKRALVVANGASHAFDSRSPSFADDVLRVTNGEGVDVVLSSLTGDFIDASMRALKPGGWFIELGKKDIWTPEVAAERAPGKHYVVYDLGESMLDDITGVRAQFAEIVDHVAAGRLAPLPWRAFPLRNAADALRYMAMAKHVGKVVLVPDGSEAEGLPPVRRDGTYLVTGGLGGLGLVVADYLAERGAGAVVLTSRRTPDADQADRIAVIEGRGTRVRVASADVGDAEAVRALRAELDAMLPPVRGIVHAAGIVADAPLGAQNVEAFDRVARAKVLGAWNLHEAFAGAPLEFVIEFSSISALNGSPGQANYAAANGFLDGFAAWRRARALPATSIAWGAWGEVGMAGRVPDAIRRRWAEHGVGLMPPQSALDGMARALGSGSTYSVVAAIDWRKAAGAPGASWTRALVGVTDPDPTAEGAATLNVEALPYLEAEARDASVAAWLRTCAAQVLGFRPELVEPTVPLLALGLDSLMAVQLRNRIEGEIGLRLEMVTFLEGASVASLVPVILDRVGAPEASGEVLVASAAGAARDGAWEEGAL